MIRFYSLAAAFIISLSLGFYGFWLYTQQDEEKARKSLAEQQLLEEKLKVAEGLIHRHHPVRALTLLQSAPLEAYPTLDMKQRWLNAYLQAAADSKEDSILQELYEAFPDLFSKREELLLKVAARYIVQGRYVAFDKMFDKFGKESKLKNQWQLLKADSLALQGRGDEAQELLGSLQLKGEEEAAKRIRTALLSNNDHPKIAFDDLSKALRAAPQNSDLHYYRGRLLENSGKEALASHEMEQASKLSPEAPFYKEEMINFYIRNKQWKEAYNALASFYATPSSSPLWIKALFFDKTFKRYPTSFDNRPLPIDNATPLLRYLISIDRKAFWNEALVKSQPAVQQLAEASKEASWLKLLDLLKNQEEKEALYFVREHPDMSTLEPNLYKALVLSLEYRLSSSPQMSPPSAEEQAQHPLFRQIHSGSIAKDTQSLLEGDDIFSALFLAAGWNEAALMLLQNDNLPANYPSWLGFALTQALRSNRTDQTALEFAYKQPPSAQLSLLIGELELKADNGAKGAPILARLAATKSQIGQMAALMLTDYYLQKGALEEAKKTLATNSNFASSLKGQERLAKITLIQGNPKEAELIYSKIVEQSAEAKSYFALKAFKEKDYKQALLLTKQLLQLYPYREDLKEQLKLILQATKQQPLAETPAPA